MKYNYIKGEINMEKKMVGIRIDTELHKKLRFLALEEGTDLNKITVMLYEKYVEIKEKQKSEKGGE